MRACFALLLIQAVAGQLRAQSGTYPDLVADWQRNRAAVLAYIDAMPDSATGFRPTPGVRTFAQQFDHIVTTNLAVAALALRGLKSPPAMGDSTVYLHKKAELRRYAGATYDYFLDALQHATPAQQQRKVAIFGQPPQPAIRLAALSLEHSVWTLGQLVPYLRLNRVTPPEYHMPF
jgi:DinB family protein